MQRVFIVLVAATMIGCSPEGDQQPRTTESSQSESEGVSSPSASRQGSGTPVADDGIDPSRTELEPKAEDEPPVDLPIIGADALYNAFETNEEEATENYANSWIGVRGVIRDRVHFVGNAEGNVLMTGPEDVRVVCQFPPEEFSKVKHGTVSRELVVQGKFDRKTSIQLWLKSCRIVEMGEDPAIEISPSKLVGTYLEDKEAAAAKFSRKPVRVQSKIVSFDEEDGSVYLQGSASGDEKPVLIRLGVGPFEMPYDVEHFHVGDIVVAQGTVFGMIENSLQIGNGHIVEKIETE